MKALKKIMLLVVVSVFFAGCAGTPKSTGTPVPSGYTYAQDPKQREIVDEGRVHKAHVRELQKMNMEHERRLVAIEHAATEAKLAEEKGLQVPTQAPHASMQTAPAAKWWTPSDPYGDGRAIPEPQPNVVVQQVPVPVPVYFDHPHSSGWTRGVRVYSVNPSVRAGGYISVRSNRGSYCRPEDNFGRGYGAWVRENREHGPYGVIPPNRVWR